MRVCIKCGLALVRPSRSVVAHGSEWHRCCWARHLAEVGRMIAEALRLDAAEKGAHP